MNELSGKLAGGKVGDSVACLAHDDGTISDAEYSSNGAYGKHPKHVCKNKMLQCINEYKNLHVNGCKDSEYNDFIRFEDSFESWDKRAILLTCHRTGKDPKDYVYITPMGVFTDIGSFARKLQKELPRDRQISVMDFGGRMNLSVFDEYRDKIVETFVASQIPIDEPSNDGYQEGWKYHIDTP